MTEVAQSAFLTGQYHQNFAANLERSPYGKTFHGNHLLRSYRFAQEMIEDNGWENPLNADVANVLQLGTANAETSKTFAYFVHKENPNAQITIADISDIPLVESLASELGDNRKIEFAQVDARRLSDYFLPNTFHMIETDGFLKFFPIDEKIQVLKQMYNALVPGGILTTREGLSDPNADDKTHDAYQRWLWHVEGYGATVYPISKRTMWELLGEAGFSRTMVRRDGLGYRKHINHIVARKPLQ